LSARAVNDKYLLKQRRHGNLWMRDFSETRPKTRD